MHSQNTPAPAELVVRPEIANSVLRMLDTGAAQYDGDEPAIQDLSTLFASLAEQIRAGESIDLAPYATAFEAEDAAEFGDQRAFRVGQQIVRELSYAFEYVGPENDWGQDWRYLSDLAALAADIEDAST